MTFELVFHLRCHFFFCSYFSFNDPLYDVTMVFFAQTLTTHQWHVRNWWGHDAILKHPRVTGYISETGSFCRLTDQQLAYYTVQYTTVHERMNKWLPVRVIEIITINQSIDMVRITEGRAHAWVSAIKLHSPIHQSSYGTSCLPAYTELEYLIRNYIVGSYQVKSIINNKTHAICCKL